ncbi:DNA mismatch repair protein Msh6 [Aplysia californica]|uniref:DNA mismatch repair protein n=1 Tax=Aplysia californica TaxID=6500 RepID=A0ABM1A6V4_APLCA|nr:DNA mismatch repair protein Msh6 [Aplysia californica]
MSKTPNSKGKQANLFSFFKKTPKSGSENSPSQTVDANNGDEKKTVSNGDVLSPKRSPNSVKGKGKTSPNSAKGKGGAKKETSLPDSARGDVVWAKLEGFPWWPSLVCDHPTTGKHVKGGKVPEVHVQFFDEPPCRAWIKARNIKPFKGSSDESFQKGGQYYSLNNKIRQGAKDADKALETTVEERLKLVVELQPSSEEEEEDEDEEEVVEKMDFDPTIFDDEMSEGESDMKENCDKPKAGKKESPQKSASASPKKSTKSKRKAAKEAAVLNKRRRLLKSDSAEEDSEDDFKPESSDDEDESASSGVDEEDVSDIEPESEPDSPVKESRKRKQPATPAASSSTKKPFSPSVSENTKSRLSLFSAPESTGSEEGAQKDATSFKHVTLDFMQPDKIRDRNRKPKSDPDYSPRTLYVPESFLNKQTPAMRQWWELKSHHFDTVLFFKVGKFYELYHMDAVAGVTELGLIYMKGDFAHSGFPEIAYTRYADALIQKGYKVARVEQTETPDMMAERCKHMGRSATKYDKVVKREVCQVSTQGTRTYSHMDGDCGDANNTYILAICEKAECQDDTSIFGVCFIDTSIGTFHIGQFEDDRHLSRFRTLVAHYTPTQVLYERGKLSQKTQTILNSNLTSALREGLSPGTEFWDSGKTLKSLSDEDYFKGEEGSTEWPQVLQNMLSKNDTLGLTAAESHDLAVRALGALTWYLQYCLMDQEMLSMKKFEEYQPIDVMNPDTQKKKQQSGFDSKQRHMVLDGVTMLNLDVVWNEGSQSTEGTLLERLDHCSTAFGKRLFRQWLCAPLCQPASIYDRLDAVEDLLGAGAAMDEAVSILKKLPDLERLLSRIHSIGSAGKSKNHPDSRAILYEEVTYSKRKIEDFLTAIDGFKACMKVTEKFKPHVKSFKSKLLRRSVTVKESDEKTDAHFPDISEDLDFFDNAFDHKKAKKDGVIDPSKGVDPDYDEAVADIGEVERKLLNYLDAQKKALSCRSLVYWGNGKNRYQLEVPESALKNIPDSYELMSSKKGAKRYRTDEINDLLAQLTDAEERKACCLKDIMRRIFHNFDERHQKWIAAVECLSVLDVLVSLTVYSRGGEGCLCRPEFVQPEEGVEPMLEIREGRHPCVSRTFEGGDFIPNDTLIGLKDENDEEDGSYSEGQVVLVTGPNMGGKSTLMRQVGLITIMAQVGCYVPAEKCRLTPVDRIFTRLGASDRIMSGESTFFVELSETSAILQHASRHSLVLLDELGRGTATYDGTAIACSVVKELSENIQCRSLFSTHYHSLVEEFKNDSNVRLGHMACMVENENEEDPSQETITFLYKFVKGACPKSYGFNAARLASIPEEVIQSALKKAKQFEQQVEDMRIFRHVWSGDIKDMRGCLRQTP